MWSSWLTNTGGLISPMRDMEIPKKAIGHDLTRFTIVFTILILSVFLLPLYSSGGKAIASDSEVLSAPASNDELLAAYMEAYKNHDFSKAREILKKIPSELHKQAKTKAGEAFLGLETEAKFSNPDDLTKLEYGSLSGTVVDAVTNQPVGQITVILYLPLLNMELEKEVRNRNPENLGRWGRARGMFLETETGQDGHFEIKALPAAGDYRIQGMKLTPAAKARPKVAIKAYPKAADLLYMSEISPIHIKADTETTKILKVVKMRRVPTIIPIEFTGYVFNQTTGEPVKGALLFSTSVSTYSDDRGYFSVTTTPGKLKLTVSHDHYQNYTNEYTVTDTDATEARIELQPITTGDLYGVVVDSVTGKPVPDVEVTMAGKVLKTDQEGHFQLLSAKAGVEPSNFTHPGYHSSTVIISLKALAKENVTIKLKPVTQGRISGIVINAANQRPVAGALVWALTERANTDTEGRFVLDKIEAGTVIIYSSAKVYVPTELDVDVTTLQTTDITISLDPITWGAVTGLVLDAGTNLPIPNMEINLAGLSVATDDQGRFIMDKVPAGNVSLTAEDPRYRPVSQSISLAATESVDITLMLDPITTGSISGVVLDAASRSPVQGAMVNIHGRSTHTDAVGRFTFEEVEAGTVVVNITAQIYVSGVQNVNVTPVNTSDIEINLEPITWGTVAVQVLDAVTKLPIPKAEITLGGFTASTDEEGRFTQEKVPAGMISVSANKHVYKPGSKTIALKASEAIDITIKLDPITTGSIAGIVLDASTKEPIAKATVTANGQAVTSDDEGRFELIDVSAGDIQVHSSKQTYQSSVVSIELAAADTLEINIHMELITTGKISGVLLDAVNGKPVKGVRIVIGNKSFETDHNGHFELDSLTAGKVQVISRHPDYKDATTELELTPAGNLKINMLLELRLEDVAELETRLSQNGTIDLYGIHFDSGKDQFKPSSLATLQALLEVIKRAPNNKFLVAGHTDSDGNDSYNQALSERRAASVIRWLVENDINKAQLTSRGYGEGQPAAPNDTESGKALNRRVQLTTN